MNSTMIRNIEIKVDIINPHIYTENIYKLGKFDRVQFLAIDDTVFNSPKGVVKVREVQQQNHASLLFYERPCDPNLCVSECHEVHLPGKDVAEEIRKMFISAYGLKGRVYKLRNEYLLGPARIHIDRVTDGGHFLEVEVLLSGEITERKGRKIANDILKKIGIGEGEKVGDYYIDLVLEAFKQKLKIR